MSGQSSASLELRYSVSVVGHLNTVHHAVVKTIAVTYILVILHTPCVDHIIYRFSRSMVCGEKEGYIFVKLAAACWMTQSPNDVGLCHSISYCIYYSGPVPTVTVNIAEDSLHQIRMCGKM